MPDAKILTQLTDFIYNTLHTLFNSIRNTFDNELILLGIAIALAYYFHKKSNEGIISKTYAVVILSILFFLMLKYI